MAFSWYLQHDILDYAPATPFVGPQPQDMARLRTHNLLLLALPGVGVPDRALVRQVLALRQKVVVLVFDSTALTTLPELHQAAAIVFVKERSSRAYNQAVQIIFGGVGAAGRPSPTLARAGFGPGQDTRSGRRLAYATPAAAGLRASLPELVDSLLKQALAAGAFPGGQVLVARHGVVALHRSYGVAQAGPGAQAEPVLNSTLYDFASLTKATAALPALLRLQDQGLFGP